MKVGILESFAAEVAKMPFVADLLAQDNKWAYLMGINFNLDAIRRDLCRTEQNK